MAAGDDFTLLMPIVIGDRDPLEVSVDGDRIVLSKYEPFCIFCGGTDGVQIFKEKNICESCRSHLSGHAS